MKIKKYIFIPILVVLCIILYAVFAKPAIETHTWVLSMAQKAEPFSVVAHKTGYDFSNDDSNLFDELTRLRFCGQMLLWSGRKC